MTKKVFQKCKNKYNSSSDMYLYMIYTYDHKRFHPHNESIEWAEGYIKFEHYETFIRKGEKERKLCVTMLKCEYIQEIVILKGLDPTHRRCNRHH